MKLSAFAVLISATVETGCLELSGNAAAEQQGEDQATTSYIGVVAPDYEPSFEEKYNVKLNLPMDEDDFIALIENLGLRYEGEGPESAMIRNRETLKRPRPPRHTRNYDMANISHSYMIYAGNNRIECRYENFLALVRDDRMVVYVENQFAYSKTIVPLIC